MPLQTLFPKEGFKNWEKEITVTVGSELTINAPLKK